RTPMRYIIAVALAAILFASRALAAPPESSDFSSMDAVSRWVANYRTKPEPNRLPGAVRTLSQLGVLKEPEGAGVYVGFVAGVLGANSTRAEDLIARMLPVAPADHWIIVRAIA